MRGWQCSCCCHRLWVCVCDTATLLPSSIHPAKIIHPKSQEEPWVERGVGLGLAEEKWDSLCSSLPCPSLTPSRMLPPGPPPHVHVLFGGCLWFNRRLSHSSDPDHPWGQHAVLGFPVRALCFQLGGQHGTCRAWERGGSVSFKCLGKLSAPACLPVLARGAGTGPSHARGAVWCQELALGER